MMRTFILLAMSMFVMKTYGQTDFSGNWILKSRQMISGKNYENGCPKQMQIEQRAESMVITKISDAPGAKEFVVEEKLDFDGTPVDTLSAAHKRKMMLLLWNDTRTAFTESILIAEPGDTSKKLNSTVDIFSMNGSFLVLDRHVTNFVTAEEWETLAMYTKQ